MDEKMPIRFTATEKWDDQWFRKAAPEVKVLYIYLCDNCDIAGFWEIDLEAASFHTGLNIGKTRESFIKLSNKYLTDDKFIWIKNFIYHQKNLPLNPENPIHSAILQRIHNHNSLRQKVLQEIEKQKNTRGLPSPSGKGYSNSNSKGNSNRGGVGGRKCEICGKPAIGGVNTSKGLKSYCSNAHRKKIVGW